MMPQTLGESHRMFDALKGWTSAQKHVVAASYLGWTLDAFDFFLLVFVLQLFLLTTLLYPDSIAEYAGYGDYFMRRRAWFFGIFASVNVFDVIDTLIKGQHHAAQYGWDYWVQAPVYIALSLVAIATTNRKFHLAFVTANLLWQVIFIAGAFSTLG